MIRKISKRLQQVSTGWVTLGALILFLVFSATVLPQQAEKAALNSGGADSPDTSFTYRVEELYKMAEVYGESGRQAYIRARFTFDVIFPLVYAAFLVTATSWVCQRTFPAESRWQLANLVPVSGMVFDFLENVSTSLVMARYPRPTAVVDRLAPAFTLVKWIFIYASFATLLAAILYGTWRWAKNRS